MSTHALTADRAGYAPVRSASASGSVSLMDRLAGWWQVRRTVRELSQLSARELADIGLVRADIRDVATGRRR